MNTTIDTGAFPTQIQLIQPSALVEHSESSRIPEMSAEEWRDFLDSVRSRNVILDPVDALPDGRVFDGRHRLRAAKELGLRLIPVIFWNITEDEALQRMSDSAVLRRSLTPGQRAAIILEFAELVEKIRAEARERSLSNLKRGNSDVPNLEHRGSVGRLNEILAEKAGIGKSSMAMLQAVQREEPELFAEVKAGKRSINSAYVETKRRKDLAAQTSTSRRKPPNDRLREIAEQSGSDANLTQSTTNDEPLTPDKILRWRITEDLPMQARNLVHDYDVLVAAQPEVVAAYTKQLRHIAEGALLLLEMFEPDELRRAYFSYIANFFLVAKNDDELKKFIKKLGGVAND